MKNFMQQNFKTTVAQADVLTGQQDIFLKPEFDHRRETSLLLPLLMHSNFYYITTLHWFNIHNKHQGVETLTTRNNPV